MTHKVLLAEGLDLLRQCEAREYENDKVHERIKNNFAKNGHACVALYQSYERLYHDYLVAAELLNFVRHTARTETDARQTNSSTGEDLCSFCAQKITAGLDRAQRILTKLDDIYLPLDKVDTIVPFGLVADRVLYTVDGKMTPLRMSQETHSISCVLPTGHYVLTVKNRDNYIVASPTITVAVLVSAPAGIQPTMTKRAIPVSAAWRKTFGVCESRATMKLEVSSNGMRDAHVDVLVQRWCRADQATTSSGGGGDIAFSWDNPPPVPAADAVPSVPACAAVPIMQNNPIHNVSESGAMQHEVAYYNKMVPDAGGVGTPIHWQSMSPNTLRNPAMCSGSGSSNPTTFHTNPPPPPPPVRDALSELFDVSLPPIPDEEIKALARYGAPYTQNTSPAQPDASHWLGTSRVSTTAPPTQSPPSPSLGKTEQPSRSGKIEINPPGLTCQERMQRLNDVFHTWTEKDVKATRLSAASQRLLQSIQNLPLPRPLVDDE